MQSLYDTDGDVDAKDEKGQTALWRAACILDVNNVNILLSRGAIDSKRR